MSTIDKMINKIQKIDYHIDKISKFIVAYAFVIVLCLISMQVFFRIFSYGIFWFEELSRYLLIMFSFLAGSIALRKNELIGVSVLESIIPMKIFRWIDLIGIMLSIYFCTFSTFYGIKISLSILKSGQPSPSMRIPMGLAYMPIPISFFLMILLLIAYGHYLIC